MLAHDRRDGTDQLQRGKQVDVEEVPHLLPAELLDRCAGRIARIVHEEIDATKRCASLTYGFVGLHLVLEVGHDRVRVRADFLDLFSAEVEEISSPSNQR